MNIDWFKDLSGSIPAAQSFFFSPEWLTGKVHRWCVQNEDVWYNGVCRLTISQYCSFLLRWALMGISKYYLQAGCVGDD